jgi:ferritin-like metal-binding protein YciE
MVLRSPADLLTQEVKEIHSAERQLSRAMPKLAKAVSSQRLREMLEKRREQGATLIESIDEALEELGTTRARKKNDAIEGLIEGANQHIEEISDKKMLDAALIGAVQKIEHYCIAAWGTVASMGRLFEQQKTVEAMERALDEGKRFDQEMTQLAETEVNPAMLSRTKKARGKRKKVEKRPERKAKKRKAVAREALARNRAAVGAKAPPNPSGTVASHSGRRAHPHAMPFLLDQPIARALLRRTFPAAPSSIGSSRPRAWRLPRSGNRDPTRSTDRAARSR